MRAVPVVPCVTSSCWRFSFGKRLQTTRSSGIGWVLFVMVTNACSPLFGSREGAFLALPNEHFKVFDTKGIGTVVVLEVLSALALFCVGIQEEKLSFLFKLFCFSGDDMFEVRSVRAARQLRSSPNDGDQADMMILLQTVTSMLEKTGITSRVPKNKELQKLTQTMFQRADTNKVSCPATSHDYDGDGC